MPAIFILFAGIFKQLFYPDLSLQGQIIISIILTWIAVLVNVVTLDIGKWVPNLGAILKVIIFSVIIMGAYAFTQNNGMANPLTFESMKPDLSSRLQYIPAMLGFELVSASSEEVTNPAKDVPRAIFISGFMIISFYTLGTIAVLAAIPAGDINLVEGLMDTLYLFLGDSDFGQGFALLLGVASRGVYQPDRRGDLAADESVQC
jgi:amino acid transporter